ncbi:MMPL family transporter [Stutzerimonas azotifigens]|uniref:MMPL family transporter n=1 Tax=Stutzerimonas azotifigens TaxID=291995 RepID=UPI00041DEEC8|nr:MMPL family transporter [Stutzerimonas azotifigens]
MPSPTDRASRRRYAAPGLFLLGLLALLAVTAWQWRGGAPISANLLQLLPEQASDALTRQAEARMQAPLNRELVLLVTHPEAVRGTQLADEIADRLDDSGLFSEVRTRLTGNLADLRRQLLEQRLALLHADDRRLLAEQPVAFVEQRLARLYDPLQGQPLVPAEQDWFGLAERAQAHLPQTGRLQIDADGRMLSEESGRRWYALRLTLAGDAFDDLLPERVAAEIEAAKAQVATRGGEALAAGGVLYSAHAQAQARREMSLIGGLSLIGALGLLLWLFRTPRIWLVALPVAVGALAGSAACVALFGQIHVLTLVLGASLIGVSLDFPLHYLSKSWTLSPWRSTQALRRTLPGLALALLSNLIGYLALAFTAFPGLTQVAVFSVAGLLGAFLCSTCLLPLLFRRPLRPWPQPLAWTATLLEGRTRLLAAIRTPWLLAGFLVFVLLGIGRVDFDDDMRQWVERAPALDQEAQRVATLTGLQPTSQYFLVRARNADELLERQAQLAERLEALVGAGRLGGYQALSQFAAPLQQQRATLRALPALLAAAGPLLELGVTPEALRAELDALAERGPISLEEVLAGPLGEPWRALWLGSQDGGAAGMVRLQGLRDLRALGGLDEGLDGVRLIDRPAQLNALFGQTQRQAALLKALACVLIVLLLWRPFGWYGALRCLAIPLLAAAGSLATLGWLGQPLTLFGLFGLLLVTAIGVDYAILMRQAVGGPAVSLLGTALAAVTTWLSFGLLLLSATPAVANFGLAVSIGLLFSFLLAPWASPSLSPSPLARSRHGTA